MRVTQKQLQQFIDRLNSRLGYNENTPFQLSLDIANGGYRVTKRFQSTAEHDLSERASARETYTFLRGMDDALDLRELQD